MRINHNLRVCKWAGDYEWGSAIWVLRFLVVLFAKVVGRTDPHSNMRTWVQSPGFMCSVFRTAESRTAQRRVCVPPICMANTAQADTRITSVATARSTRGETNHWVPAKQSTREASCIECRVVSALPNCRHIHRSSEKERWTEFMCVRTKILIQLKRTCDILRFNSPISGKI